MLFRNNVLEEIKTGRITLAFRQWTRPTVKSDGSLRTPVGILAIESVETVRPDEISDEDAGRAGFNDRKALLAELRKGKGGELYRIAFHLSGPDPREALQQQTDIGVEELAAIRKRLAVLDENSRTGAWTTTALQLIGEYAGQTAGNISESLGITKPTVKRKIRQLKELGLTESLQSGYRLSERGHVVHNRLSD
ncbi:hypothetical protein [Roseinatronobacter alkalisoli]|uniref:ASCH domain-containing protein n=1 Tax=Roseinatronobacter alkalisoli TaxID=3028235 RepID=A0ABT5T9N5_9RHOB|nr:hypothetical protein [Roseinatronobacter sp. HJB301]MDD7970638.1 hypothetical protein [Roseinatronobacter sp. HJB301]